MEFTIDSQLSYIRSDRSILGAVLLNMLESALQDPRRDSEVQFTIQVKELDKFSKATKVVCEQSFTPLDV